MKAAGAAVRSSPIVAYPSLYVLKHTVAPAVLLECGFHTNQEETALLKDDGYRQKLAQAQAYGILDYLGIDTDDTPEDEEPAELSEADKAVAWGDRERDHVRQFRRRPHAGSACDAEAIPRHALPLPSEIRTVRHRAGRDGRPLFQRKGR